ncbi:zonular occludens toxin domain-containing protein [Pseudomonas aeruginosa]|uniref:zonular occludens toxin domain-containing protein n=1 Tax=Pseudomonas aeruginosa TaxID=287 RepID=UPI00217ECC4C|nr:zonular occludens toxin domain-containing protein [Pseudomonas aeruginosa]UWG52568.1 hypothetical protein NOQ96_17660 [Pseudomonas aeruginosa]
MIFDQLFARFFGFFVEPNSSEWFNLPDGSVIVIDEAQRVFGNDGTRARPEKVTRFETHPPWRRAGMTRDSVPWC